MLKFEKNDYTIEEVTLCGETIRFRAFRDLIISDKGRSFSLSFRILNKRALPADWLKTAVFSSSSGSRCRIDEMNFEPE